MRKSVVIGLLILVAAGVFVSLVSPGEPRYRGRTLTSWLEQCSDASLMETQRLSEAEEAIRTIGAEKALPKLIELVRTKDGPLSAWIVSMNERFDSRFKIASATECQLQGIAGFEALGTNGAPAVPQLTAMLDDKEFAFVAVRCLAAIGKPAESALCRCLTNQDWRVRNWSVDALAYVTDDVEVYIARIKGQLADTNSPVRFATIQAIGAQTGAPELAIPILIDALHDPDDNVSTQAANALSGLGTNAISAFPALQDMAITGGMVRARAAMNALPAIAPIEAVSVLSNAVVVGSSSNLGAALRSLKSVAPELSAQMTAAEIRSADPVRRFQAIGAGMAFDVETPGVAAALKAAAADPDPRIAQRATMAMTQMLRERKETEKNLVLSLPNEPTYQGRSLGEWLKVRDPNGELSINAVEAFRGMGTNAILALVERVGYEDPRFGIYDVGVGVEAMTALIALREQATPAIPGLIALMDRDNEDLAVRAMVASLGTGRNGMACLTKGLTNQYPSVRSEAINYLTGDWGAQFPEERQQAIPLLIKLQSDVDKSVRESATNGLKEINGPSNTKSRIR